MKSHSQQTQPWRFKDGIKRVNVSWLISQKVVTPHCVTWSRLIVTIVGTTHIFGGQEDVWRNNSLSSDLQMSPTQLREKLWEEISSPSNSPKPDIPQLDLHTFAFRLLRLYYLQKCRCHRVKATHMYQSFATVFLKEEWWNCLDQQPRGGAWGKGAWLIRDC